VARDRGPVTVVLACGVVELASWAVLYYVVPILSDRITAEGEVSTLQVTAAYSASLVVAALLGPAVGRVVDAHGPRLLVAVGAVVGALGLVVASSGGYVVFVVGLLLTGVGQAATLYPPVLAALTIWFGERETWPLTVVTIFGGLSSTLVAPVLAPLAVGVGWRAAVAWVAVGYVVVVLPVALLGLGRRWHPGTRTERQAVVAEVDRVRRSARFRWLQVSMLLAAVSLYAVTLNLVPLLRERGHSYGFAAVVFGLVGLGQVVGRVAYLPVRSAGQARARTAAYAAASAAVVLLVGGVSGDAVLAVAAAIAAGTVRGVHALVMTHGPADRWGSQGFGTLTGHFTRPVALGVAVSPFVGSAVALGVGSWSAATVVLGAAAGLGVVTARLS